MKIDKDRIRTMFLRAGDAVIAAEQELTEILAEDSDRLDIGLLLCLLQDFI